MPRSRSRSQLYCEFRAVLQLSAIIPAQHVDYVTSEVRCQHPLPYQPEFTAYPVRDHAQLVYVRMRLAYRVRSAAIVVYDAGSGLDHPVQHRESGDRALPIIGSVDHIPYTQQVAGAEVAVVPECSDRGLRIRVHAAVRIVLADRKIVAGAFAYHK